MTNFSLESDMLLLFTPTTSSSVGHRHWAIVGSELPAISMLYIPVQMIIHASGRNVIEYEGFQRAFQVLEAAKAIDGLDQLCVNETGAVRVNGKAEQCETQGVTRFWNNSRSWFEEEVPEGDDVTRFLLNSSFPDGRTVDLERVFGMLEMKEEDGIPLSAEALFVEITIPLSRVGSEERLRYYTEQLQQEITNIRESWIAENPNTDYRVEFAIWFDVGGEFRSAIFSDFPLLPFIFFIMVAFTCSVFWRRNRVKSRLLLALGAVITVLFSLSTAFGIMFTIGIPYSIVTTVLPYIVFGVGLDDTYILHEAFVRSDPTKSIVIRVEETFQEVGLSIIMTSVTTALAFGLGSISSIPAIVYLCYYAVPAIIVDFFYQVTFFVALLVIDERRVQARRLDCCMCFVSDVEDTDSESVGSSIHDSDSSGILDDTEDQETAKAKTPPSRKQKKRSFMAWYADQINRTWVKAAILLAFAALLACCTYGATLLKQDFSFYDLLPDESSTKTYLEAKENYGGMNGEIFLYFKGGNQSDAEYQDLMIDFIDKVDQIEHVELMPFCWVRDMRALVTDPDNFINNLMEDPATAHILENSPDAATFIREQSVILSVLPFNEVLDTMMAQPLVKALYAPHVKRVNNTGDVNSSRCKVKIRNLDYNNVQESVNLLNAQNKVTNDHPINNNGDGEMHAFLYNELFHLWEVRAFATNAIYFL